MRRITFVPFLADGRCVLIEDRVLDVGCANGLLMESGPQAARSRRPG
ncbi:MAG: hypothetical protein ACRDOE_25965 [Streptosporangiaceae bacterium]